MPHIDQIVLSLILAGLVASVVDHWRGGQRGWRLAALTFISFFGIGLVTMMAGHCADIIYNLVRANRSVIDGSPFTYNWRTYSLLLFGVLLIDRGMRCLRAARRFAKHDDAARRDILENAGVVLAITLPTIPVHAFFGGLMSGWSSLALIVTVVGLRGALSPRRRQYLARWKWASARSHVHEAVPGGSTGSCVDPDGRLAYHAAARRND